MGSPQFIEKIRHYASQRLGAEVSFKDFDVSLLSGIQLHQATIRTDAGGEGNSLFSIDRISVEYAPASLLNKTIEITRIELDHPVVSLQERPSGGWNLPAKSGPPAGGDSAPAFDTGGQQFAVVLRSLAMRDAAFTVQDAQGERLVSMEGIQLDGRFESRHARTEAGGAMKVGRMVLGPYFTMTDVAGEILLADEKLELKQLHGSAHGGEATGAADAHFGPAGSGFTLQIKLDQVDMATLMRDFGGKGDFVTGKGFVQTSLAGDLKEPLLLSGPGTLKITGARLAGLSALQDLGKMLGIKELEQTQFETIDGEFKIADQRLTFYKLEARSGLVQMTGNGYITFDKTMDFNLLLLLGSDLAKLVPQQIRPVFDQGADGSLSLAFKVEGPLEAPRNDLKEKLAGSTLNNVLLPALQDLLFKGKDKQPQNPEPSPAPEPPAGP